MLLRCRSPRSLRRLVCGFGSGSGQESIGIDFDFGFEIDYDYGFGFGSEGDPLGLRWRFGWGWRSSTAAWGEKVGWRVLVPVLGRVGIVEEGCTSPHYP